MTPSMGMGGPKGMAAPQAGLAAIAQPSQAPKGRTSGSMAQVMAMARKMSDGQLAEVLQGKSLDVPQYVAMTEAMGRKSLRTAMEGQQAQQQAQQPSVKDKLLMGDQPQMPPQGMPPQGMPPQQPVMAAEGGLMYADGGAIDMNEGQGGGGIAELPAPNMMPMTMAGGGIVAFEEGGEVPRFNQGVALTDEQIEELRTTGRVRRSTEDTEKALQEQKDFFMSPRTRAAMKSDPAAKAAAKAPVMSEEQLKDQLNSIARGQGVFPEGSPALPGANLAAAPAAPPAAKLPPVVNPGAPVADKEKAGLGATDEFKSYMDTVKKNNADYLSELKGLSAKQREGIAQLTKQGGGEALMAISRGLLSKGTLAQGVAEGLPGVMAASAGTRKERRAIEQGADEMDFNLAKAQQAAAKGDMEAALMFKRLADEASYRKDSIALQRAQLNKPDSNIALLNALGDPELMKRYKEMQAGKKGELYSIDKATDDFNKIAGDKFSDQAKQLKALGITTPYQYQQYVLNQSGGGGFDLSAAAKAELERRSKS